MILTYATLVVAAIINGNSSNIDRLTSLAGGTAAISSPENDTQRNQPAGLQHLMYGWSGWMMLQRQRTGAAATMAGLFVNWCAARRSIAVTCWNGRRRNRWRGLSRVDNLLNSLIATCRMTVWPGNRTI